MTQQHTKRIPIGIDDVDYARVLYYPRQVHFFVLTLEEFFNDRLGVSWKRMMDDESLAMPTVHLDVTYRQPLCYGDQADIGVWVEQLGRRKVVFGYEVASVTRGSVTCQARQTCVFVDTSLWKAVPIPESYRRLLSGFVTERGPIGS